MTTRLCWKSVQRTYLALAVLVAAATTAPTWMPVPLRADPLVSPPPPPAGPAAVSTSEASPQVVAIEVIPYRP